MSTNIRHDPCDDTWTITLIDHIRDDTWTVTLNSRILGVCDTLGAARSLLDSSLHRGDCPEYEATVESGMCQGSCRAVPL